MLAHTVSASRSLRIEFVVANSPHEDDMAKVLDFVVLSSVYRAGSYLVADPAAISLVVTAPSGATTTYSYPSGTLNKSSVGHFNARLQVTEVGEWSYVWSVPVDGTAEQGGFEVLPAKESVTFTIKDALNVAVDGVLVDVGNGVAARTDASGVVRFRLVPGAYQTTFSKSRAVIAPRTVTVVQSGTLQNFAVTASLLSITDPSAFRVVRLFGNMVHIDGTPNVGVRVELRVSMLGTDNSFAKGGAPGTGLNPTNAIVSETTLTRETDSAGYWEIDVLAGAVVFVTIQSVGYEKTIRIPDDARITTLNLRDAMGDPGNVGRLGITTDTATYDRMLKGVG